MRQLLAVSLFLFNAGTVLAEDAHGKSGAALYATHCVACHQAEAVGAPGIAPPLAGHIGRHAGNEAGRKYLVHVPLTGMVGAITVDGVRYTGNMPSFAALSDDDIARVVGHVLREFNGVSDLSWLTPEFVGAVRKVGGTPNETHRQRARLPAERGA